MGGASTGFTITSYEPFATVFRPLLPDLALLHWLLDLQAGPFRITDRPDWEALHLLLDALSVDLPALHATSATLWRPGTLAVLADLLLHDEQSWYFGLSGERDAATAATLTLVGTPWDARLLEILPRHVHFLAFYGYDRWEVLVPNPQLAREVACLPAATPLDPIHASFVGGTRS